MSPLETIREAVRRIREDAGAATPGPWVADVRRDGRAWIDLPGIDGHAWGMHGFGANARHIAGWHPAVALAVADWLNSFLAGQLDETAISWRLGSEAWHALDVARAYLNQKEAP